MIVRILILTTVMMLFSGCASTYNYSEFQAPVDKLDPSLGVLISVPEDGWYENTQYRNSGRMTVNAVRAAFSKNASKVDIAQDCHDEECLDKIDVERYGYFVKPVILHWEDRATEWSGKPDRIEIQIVIYDAITKSELANSSYTGKSKWATFGGDHPQDLLPEPTNEYVSNLYQ
ncbi:DUF4823 domain-containing protein [Pseudidiomarina sp.]|uniref:DUF4823 domain-containing protein n=1 Tax=Pseudidiomarina sp. TaxID=2081707 RepID=UPI003A988371